jgi:hypothetical protein
MKKAREEGAEKAAEAARKKKPRNTATAEAGAGTGAAGSPPGGVASEIDTRAKCLLLLGEAMRDPTPLYDTATAVEVRMS